MGASRARIARIAAWPATFAWLTVTAPSVFAADLYVPGDYKSIQDAVNASVDGDSIWVAAGTYHENVNLLGKSILLSSAGAARPTIDGDALGPCVTQDSGKATATLDGFRLIDGEGRLDAATGETFGGGVFHTAGQLLIVNCVIRGCKADCGGALFAGSDQSTDLFDCRIAYCNRMPLSNRGGGIAVIDSTVTLHGTTIEDCGTVRFTSSGGGLHALRSDPSF